MFLVGVTGFIVASAAGIGAVVTRLLDFRLTARKVRTGSAVEPLTLFGTDATGYGKATWRLFWTLLVSFAAAVLATVIEGHRERRVGEEEGLRPRLMPGIAPRREMARGREVR